MSFRTVLLLIAVVLPSIAASKATGTMAGTATFRQMKERMDGNSLPLVNLTVELGAVSRERFVHGEIEIADYHGRLDGAKNYVKFSCLIRYRGRTAAGFEKKAFGVKLLDENGGDLDADLFGIRKENSWVLDALAIDRCRMRNRVCFDLWNELSRTPYDTNYEGRNGTRGLFVEVFINGTYQGLYCFSDKIDRKLLGLKMAKQDDGGGVTVRGVLYKGVNWNDHDDIYLLSYKDAPTDGTAWNSWELKYPEDYPSAETWQPLKDLIDFCSAKTGDDDFGGHWQDHFHMQNLLDYFVFTLALNVGDNAYKNTYLSLRDIGGDDRRFLITPWDMDQSFGSHWSGRYDETTATLSKYDGVAPFNRLFPNNIDGFRDEAARLWSQLNDNVLAPAHIFSLMESYARQLVASGAWQRERERWDGNPVTLKESPLDELEYVKDWYQRNYDALDAQFESVGIDDATVPQPSATVFTLGGQVATSTFRPGIYILNGRKRVVKE